MTTPSLAEKIIEALEKECGIVTNSQWTSQPETVIQSVIDAHQKEQDMQKEDWQPAPRETAPLDTQGRDYWKAQFHKIHDERDGRRAALDAANEKRKGTSKSFDAWWADQSKDYLFPQREKDIARVAWTMAIASVAKPTPYVALK